MAFNKITSSDLQNKGVIGLADTPGLTTTAMQQKFDEIALDVIVPKFNALIDDIEDAGLDPSTGDAMHKAVYDTDNDGIVDNAEKVNNHTVLCDVPEDAVFTDTVYDDTEIREEIAEKADADDIPTKTSDLTNDSGFITSASVPTKTSDLTNDSGFITSSSVPTKTSQLTNDSGFITSSAVPTKTSDLTNDSGFITSSAVPTKTSQLTNDSGFITASSVPSDIEDLDNVTVSSPSNGQVLGYNSSTQKWENSSAGTGDMTKAVYDSDSAVSTAGGIKNYCSTFANDADLTKAFIDIAEPFSTSDSYAVGDYVIYEKYLYRCITNHSGEWNSSHFSQVEMGNELSYANGQIESISSAISGISSKMDNDGSNAASHVKFSGSFTVGNRETGSSVGTYSTSEGIGNSVSGNYAHASGNLLTAAYENQFVTGYYNKNKSDTLFEVGSGTGMPLKKRNVFEVYSSGYISQDDGTTKFKFTKSNNADGYYDKDGTFHAFMTSLPIASANSLGGIKVGNNLSIDANGVLSATGGSGGATSLAGLDDVSISSQSDGQVLAYNSSSSKWKNASLGTASTKDVPASGNASTSQVVMGDDTRLSDARTPVSHTHTVSQITDFPTLATVATSGSYTDLSNKPTIPQGDMEASDYDPNGTVATAGGIVAYIDATITAALTASY